MTLVQLRHFVGLAERRSFVQAAKLLFVTQPALTRSIQALEEELGAPLFDRVGRRIALTPFGQEVLERARRLVSEADALRTAHHALSAGLMGQLRVGLSSAPGALLSTPLMLHMARHHPRLRVQIARGQTDLLVEQLRQQKLDAVIVDARSLRPATDLQLFEVFELPAGFLVRPGHPLAQAEQAVTLADLRAYPIASTPLSDEVARLLIGRYGPEANPDHMVTLQCDETLTLIDVTRRSDTVLLTVTALAADLVRLNVNPPLQATARFALVTLNRREWAPALRLLQTQVRQWVQSLG